jgi:hypothetical protein
LPWRCGEWGGWVWWGGSEWGDVSGPRGRIADWTPGISRARHAFQFVSNPQFNNTD